MTGRLAVPRHCAEALTDGKSISGMRYDRVLEYEVHRQAERKAARNATSAEPIKRGDFMTPYELKLAPLPGWRNLPRVENPAGPEPTITRSKRDGSFDRAREGKAPRIDSGDC